MFKKIDHIELVTDQPDRTVAFYTEILGFRLKSKARVEQSAMNVPLDLIYLELGGTMIEVMHYDGATPPPPPEGEHLGYRLMAIEVDDLPAAIAYLASKGVAVTWGPKIRPTFARAEIMDPNGVSIELRQWITPAVSV